MVKFVVHNTLYPHLGSWAVVVILVPLLWEGLKVRKFWNIKEAFVCIFWIENLFSHFHFVFLPLYMERDHRCGQGKRDPLWGLTDYLKKMMVMGSNHGKLVSIA